MKFQTYTATPGLDRYPVRERFAKWKEIHKRLLFEDANYKKRFNSYLISVCCLSCPLMGVYGYYFGTGLASFVANLAVTAIFTAIIVYLAFRQILFMNQRIGNYLQSNHNA